MTDGRKTKPGKGTTIMDAVEVAAALVLCLAAITGILVLLHFN